MTIPTTERLALVLTQAGAPRWMIDNARAGYYDDYKTTIATPIVRLCQDCTDAGLTDLADRARNGEFDATRYEAEEWAKSPEAQELLKSLARGY